jgi:hypothetical protein
VHRYEKLEKLYYKRKILKFLIIFFILILIFGLFFLITNNRDEEKKNNVKNVKKVEKNFTKKFFNSITNKSKKDLNKTQKISKKEKIKNNSEFLVIDFKVPVIDLNLSKKEDLNKTKNITKKTVIKKVATPKLHKKNENFVIIEENININDLIKNFNNHPSFDTAIQISEYYLNKNYFNLAKKWALKANSIDANRYESWKIFAIILLKRGEKEKAKEVLKTYLNEYNQNDEIQKLLRSIDE